MADMLMFLGVSGLVKYSVYYYWRNRLPADAVLAGHVTKLNIFPVKSMRELDVSQMNCTSNIGPCSDQLIDRQFMVVTKELKLLSIRDEPKLILMQPQFDGSTLTIHAPEGDDVIVDTKNILKQNKVLQAIAHGSEVVGLDGGEAVSKWLDTYLRRDGLKLLYATPEMSRRNYQFIFGDAYSQWTKHAKPDDKLFFQDVSPFHLLSKESAKALGAKIVSNISPMQFRPNIVVTADAGSHDEDTWKEIFIGEARFKTNKWTDRCTLPTIDRTTGVRNSDNEPLKTLKSYRCKVPGKGPMFGIDMVVEKPGMVKVGDPIYVIRGFDMNTV